MHGKHSTLYLAIVAQLYLSCYHSNLLSKTHMYIPCTLRSPLIIRLFLDLAEYPSNSISLFNPWKFSLPSKEHFKHHFLHETFSETATIPDLFLFWTLALLSCSKIVLYVPCIWLILHSLTTRCFNIYVTQEMHVTHLYILWESCLQRLGTLIVEPYWIPFMNLHWQEKVF